MWLERSETQPLDPGRGLWHETPIARFARGAAVPRKWGTMKSTKRSEAAAAYRRLYATRRWQGIRADQLACQPWCEMCLGLGVHIPATVCNHINKTLKATTEGFFAGPFNSLCKMHHDSTQQRQERRGHVIGCDESGWPIDHNHPWNRERGGAVRKTGN